MLPIPGKLIALIASRNQKMVLALMVLLLACLWSAVVFWVVWERAGVIAAKSLMLQQLTNAVLEQTQDLFQQAETTLTIVSDWTEKHVQEDPSTSPDFIGLVDKLRNGSRGLIELRMVTRSGELRLIPGIDKPRNISLLDRDYVRAHFEGRVQGLLISDPVIGKSSTKWTIPISIAVQKAGGDIAILIVAIELDRIASVFEPERLKPNGTIVIVKNDGHLLFRSPAAPEEYGKPIAPEAELRRYMAMPSRGVLQIDRSPVDGISRLVSYARSNEYPVAVLVTAGTDDVLQPWRLHATVLTGIASALSVLTLVYGHILLRSMDKEVAAKAELERLMLTDPLTGVGNRRHLSRRLNEEVIRAERYARPLTIVFFDLDHFKLINDKYGHKVGDLVLMAVAKSLCSTVRHSDMVGRFGGEEFVAILAETTAEEALLLVERMRQSVEQLKCAEIPDGVTVSAGMAQWKSGENSETLLQRSDKALYKAKAEGRNRTCVAP